MSLYIASNYRVKLDKSLEYGISVPSTWHYIKSDTLFNLKWPKIVYKNQQQKIQWLKLHLQIFQVWLHPLHMFMIPVLSIYYLNTFYTFLSYEVCLW